MGGLTHEEYAGWRNKIADSFRYSASVPDIFDPSKKYNYENIAHKTEKEIMRYELRQVLSSDLVILKLDGANTSVGTMFEVAYAFNNNIPIIGLAESGETYHPWLEEACDRIETSYEDIVEYISEYYLD